jgi:hypothetical protein
MFLMDWFGSLSGLAFFTDPQFDFLISSFEFIFVEMLSFFRFTPFDVRKIDALCGVPNDVSGSALEKAKQGFSMDSKTQGDDDEVDDDMQSEMHFRSKFFQLAAKDQLYTSKVAGWRP